MTAHDATRRRYIADDMELVIGTERALAGRMADHPYDVAPGPGGAVSCKIGSLCGDHLP